MGTIAPVMASDSVSDSATDALERALTDRPASNGKTLAELSAGGRVLVVFLRCRGCPFCHEAMSDLKKRRGALGDRGASIVLVHQLPAGLAQAWLDKAGLGDCPHISDPELGMYRAFELSRGSPMQLAGPKVLLRMIQAALAGHFVGKVAGDAMQMPGVFVVEDGRVVASFRHRTQADRPDYLGLVAGAGR